MWETRKGKYHTHGGTKREIGIDFSVNINPIGIPKGCLGAAQKALLEAEKYPDVYHDELIEELSAKNGGHQVILGNGSCELIYAICHCLSHKYPGYEAYTIDPTFSEYGYAITASGGKNRVFRTGAEYDFSLSAGFDEFMDSVYCSILSGALVKLIFICNPNNPTGELIKRDRIERMAEDLKRHGTIIVVDECFLRFDKRYKSTTMTKVLTDHDNVIVLDAFTKYYAMPGLRLGYAISSDKGLLDDVREAIQPWNVSESASAAAMCALGDRDYEDRTIGCIEKQREYLKYELKQIPLKVIGDSAGPFIMFEGPDGLRETLNSRGLDIRDCSDMLGQYNTGRHYYRIAVRNEEDNRYLIEELRSLTG